MIDFSASIAAQQVMRKSAHSARPNAPMRPDAVPMAHQAGVVAARRRVSVVLHRLAEIVQPAGSGATWPLPASR